MKHFRKNSGLWSRLAVLKVSTVLLALILLFSTLLNSFTEGLSFPSSFLGPPPARYPHFRRQNNRRQSIRRQYHSRQLSSNSCRSPTASCEPMIGCILTAGVATAPCGVLGVCCESASSAGPTTVTTLNSSPYQRYSSNHLPTSGPPLPPPIHHHPYHHRGYSRRGRNLHLDYDYEDSPIDRHGKVINDPQCGKPYGPVVSANRRVLDGQPAGFGNFPWQALITVGKGKCGGVLINHRHVVTAGHCVKNKPLNRVVVKLGEYNLKRIEPLPSQTFKVIRAAVHPRFQFSPAADRFDVAVLTLDRHVRYAPHIAPICLPEAGRDPEPGTTAYVAGWGALIPDDVSGPLIQFLVPEVKRPSVLQVVNVPVLENERCESWHHNAGIKVTIFDEMVCAGYRNGGKDSCKGDSGGPLMVQQADGRWVLIGLVSAGFSCGKPGQPGIYHRISSTSDWITNQAYHHRFFIK